MLMTGCRGCRSERKTPEEIKAAQEEAKKEREKPTFEIEEPVVYPGQYENTARTNRVKPGHWTTTDFRITANKFAAQGDMKCYGSRNIKGLPVEDTDYIAVSNRPFSLPKGESKSLESSVYLPRREGAKSSSITYSMSRSGGGIALFAGEPRIFNLLKSFEYHLVVLTNRPDSYGYVPNMDCVNLPKDEFQSKPPSFYNVVRTRPSEGPITLPRQTLNWTTIAYLVWDNLTVDQLDADQQQAMLDWIHFGGQLIISGPDGLDKLKSSFLADYLPATVAGTRNLVARDFTEINEHWALKDSKLDVRRVIQVDEKSPLIGVDFDMHPDASFVNNTGKIVAERQVGRGRIVVSSFSLSAKPVIGWGSFKSFFNGALLRKPSRKFGETVEGQLAFRWLNDDTSIFDPLLGSTLRFLSRDLAKNDINTFDGQTGTPVDPRMSVSAVTGMSDYGTSAPSVLGYNEYRDGRLRIKEAPIKRARNLEDHWHYGGFQHEEQSGTAGWNDSSGISTAARETLKQAAGITPPSSRFVFRMLAVYLLVLVPINWAIFRMVGRVEWAWIAAPFIAIGGALMVARMASLDIGFVRSNSQVSCLEIYSDYSRAHIAQYSALYTSLSTGYELELDNPTAQALPLGDPTRNKNREKTPTLVTLRKTLATRLEGFQVQSNSTGMLHTEMMVDLLGTISLNRANDELRVANSTAVKLSDAAVLRRTEAGELQAAWIGELEIASESAPVKFTDIDNAATPWRDSNILKRQDSASDYWNQLKPNWQQVQADQVDSNGRVISRDENKVRVGDVKDNIAELARKWDEFVGIMIRNVGNTENDINQTMINYKEFSAIITQMGRVDGLNVSRMFNAVSRQLALAPGEIRMIAVTNQPIGKNAFSPAATQTKEQTLVVVHLQRPKFADAKPDKNSLEDISETSYGDWYEQQQDQALDEEPRQEGIEDSEEDVTNEDENQK